jgi:hypothetical protein
MATSETQVAVSSGGAVRHTVLLRHHTRSGRHAGEDGLMEQAIRLPLTASPAFGPGIGMCRVGRPLDHARRLCARGGALAPTSPLFCLAFFEFAGRDAPTVWRSVFSARATALLLTSARATTAQKLAREWRPAP